jgi:hypothetical protein
MIFVVALCRPMALDARLPHQPARMPFTQSLFSSVVNGHATPLGPQKFPSAMSFKICFSTLISAIAPRSWHSRVADPQD